MAGNCFIHFKGFKLENWGSLLYYKAEKGAKEAPPFRERTTLGGPSSHVCKQLRPE